MLGAFESPDTLDPLAAATDSGVRASALLFSPLWGLDPGLHPYPDLVREVPALGAGGTSLDVTLVRGLRWSDGAPITSDDVIFTWRAITDPAVGAQVGAGFEHVTSIDRRSDTETVWHFDRPDPAYLQLGPAMALLPAHRLAGLPHREWAGSGFFQSPDVVSGPFTLARHVPESELDFAANPRYADGRSLPGAYAGPAPFTHAAHLDRVVYRLFPGKDGLLRALRAGAVDAAFGLDPEEAGGLSGYPGVRAEVHTGLRDEFLNPNHDVNTATGRPPPWVGDAAVLDALALALDREALVSGPLRGAARPSRGLYPRPLAGWGDPATRLVRDLAGARSRLDQDGWKAGADGVRVKAGRPLEFSLLAVCPTSVMAGVLDALKRQWAEAGARVQAECRPRALFFAGFAAQGTNASGAFDMTAYSNAWGPDPGAWAPVGESAGVPSAGNPSGLNWNRCRDARLDADLDRVTTALGGARRDAARAAERDWLAVHCTIPLYESPEVRGVAGRFHELTSNPAMAAETWNAADWWVAG